MYLFLFLFSLRRVKLRDGKPLQGIMNCEYSESMLLMAGHDVGILRMKFVSWLLNVPATC